MGDDHPNHRVSLEAGFLAGTGHSLSPLGHWFLLQAEEKSLLGWSSAAFRSNSQSSILKR